MRAREIGLCIVLVACTVAIATAKRSHRSTAKPRPDRSTAYSKKAPRPVRSESKQAATQSRPRARKRTMTTGRMALGGGCGGNIVEAVPASGTEDARQPHPVAAGSELDPALRQGIGSVDEPIIIVTDQIGQASCFTLCENTPDSILGANGIASVTEVEPMRYEIVLNHAIAPNTWTTISLNGCQGSDCFVEYLSNPGNVDHNSATAPLDIIAIIDYINGAEEPPFGIYSTDVDHSGATNPSDILGVINLLNGADAFSPQQGIERPDNLECPPAQSDNDECAGARVLSCGESATIFISEEGYTENEELDPTSTCELAAGGPFFHDASWWYQFTAPQGTSTMTVSMCETADNEDTVVTVFTPDSTCDTLGELSCDDDGCVPPPAFGPSEVTTAVIEGQTYLVLVDRYEGGLSTDGPYTINLTCSDDQTVGACCLNGGCAEMSLAACVAQGGEFQGPETVCGGVECPVTGVNDTCSAARQMGCGDIDIVSASDYTADVLEDPASSCELNNGGPFGHDASWWYEFTADEDAGQVTISMCNTADNEDAVVTMFTSGSICDALTELTCDDDDCVPPGQFGPSELTAPVVPGQSYLVLVDRYSGGTSTDGPYEIEFTCGDAGAGGACCSTAGCADDVTQALCETGGGLYQGDGSLCVDVECPDLSNDDCGGATPIFDGATEFSTLAASTDGPPVPETCDEGFGVDFGQDIWFNYSSTCTGDATFSTCDSADFDTRLLLYEGCGVCPPEPLVGCNDDGTGCGGFTSELVVEVTEGTCYALRVGGFGAAAGTGTLNISCEGGNTSCMDAVGDCCSENGSAGCEDPSCCATVCNIDSFCCEVDWDSECAGIAGQACQTCALPGACCVGGVCSDDVNEAACLDQGGSFQGEGQACADVTCPDSSNDDCGGARALTCGDTDTIFITDGYTTGGLDDPTSSCETAGGGPFAHDASWWYVFTAPEGVTDVTVSMCQTAEIEDTVLTLFTNNSTCGALFERACDDDSCAPGFTPSELSTSVVPGESYLILVDRYAGGTSTDGPYTIEITCP